MIKEAIDFVLGEGRKTVTPEFMQIKGDAPHVFYLRKADGSIERVETTLSPATATLETVSAFTRFIDDTHGGVGVFKVEKPAVFLTQGGALYVPDTQTGRTAAKLPLLASEEVGFFDARDKAPLVDPVELRYALRVTLCDAGVGPKLIEQVSKVDFAAATQANVSLDRGRESLGNAVQRQVQSAVGLPDEQQVFSVRMFANADMDFREPLRCLLDPEAASRRWLLKPLNLVEFKAKALKVVEDVIEGQIDEDIDVPIYRGVWLRG